MNNTPKPNRITISDRYIRETSKDICQFIDEGHEMETEEKEEAFANLLGRIAFIQYFSLSSFRKLERMVSVKSGKKVDLSDLSIDTNG